MTKLARSLGVLLPIPALPSRWGIGDLGPSAYRFAEQLARAGVRYWQLLPWGPTTPALDNSPYNALSAFAGNLLWIGPEQLYAEGFCRRQDLTHLQPYAPQVDYAALTVERMEFLARCFERSAYWRHHSADFEEFCSRAGSWLEEWVLFAVLREHFRGAPWYEWPPEYRRLSGAQLEVIRRRHANRLEFHRWVQFLFFRQMERLRSWCLEQGVELIGDLPLFVAHDSADVWARPERFLLMPDGRPEYLSGAPPDVYNPQGQLWGQPLYRWEVHRAERFQWWMERVSHVLRYVRWLRLDHFRGYVACWAVRSGASTAAEGSWMPTPSEELFQLFQSRWMPLPFLPEDLGTITPDVELLRCRLGLPSMRVLLFAFPDPAYNPHAPHSCGENTVLYTSLHDTPPVRGWFLQAPEPVRKSVAQYCGHAVSARSVHWDFLRLALQSAAWLVVVPVQDICGLGAEAQINRPGTAQGNWRWRLSPGMPHARHWERLAEMSALFGRYRR
ncbi:MAG: 4-alpha-glucanotransferase [Candidatus Kapabacteria bacterium]|nr:4-alpha-glucanotransferase [Candidatus Kapabacteria bacterium]MDW8011580.1 4-alpha-glucanotransferase [Bacteroidota bacterium]